MELLRQLGKYSLLMAKTFGRPEKGKVFRQRLVDEIDQLGIDSLGLVSIMSVFMGAVTTLQMAVHLENPLVPKSLIGFATRESMILEFSPTMMAVILAGKVGSNISSEIGTMRVKEQIDALDIMGINSANYLIFPKILAALLIFPFLIVVSMALGIGGGYVISLVTGVVAPPVFLEGILDEFKLFHVIYALVKTLFFAFIITSISSYQGYNTSGGALEVGRSSTKGVVQSTILILIMDLVLTKLMLI
ncbi:MAG: ABC transporter permease [Bacteroidota bacterium]